ncbi:MAG: Holliday junction branch migration protein RuvA [Chitinophagaceae bacterium]
MIAFLQGEIQTITPAWVWLNVHGVGYELHISSNTYEAIANAKSAFLYTHLQITENAHTLYGFAEVGEKTLFLHLISVSGVGAATARLMLSGMRPEEIVRSIVQGNVKQLESIKGIGKKTAERLIVELREKLGKASLQNPSLTGNVLSVGSSNTGAGSAPEYDAVEALIALGIHKNIAENAVKAALTNNNGNTDTETLIKLALKNL